MQTKPLIRMELGNKIRNGRAVGNVYHAIYKGREGRHSNILATFDTTEQCQNFITQKLASGVTT